MNTRALVTVALLSLGYSGVSHSATAEEAAKIAGDTGCGILATLLQNPQLAVAAAGACIYGTSTTTSVVGDYIDQYFEGKDQEFANKYCVTIVKADGKKIDPTNKASCSKE
jgi:hypothetical protein